MPRRLLLDGEDLAGLMLRVRTEMGPGAVVVKAERVRTGGVAGFFAKEHYELTVEVPEPQARPPRRLPVRPAGRAASPAGISALLDAADAAESRAAGGSGEGPTTAPGSGAIEQLGWISATPVAGPAAAAPPGEQGAESGAVSAAAAAAAEHEAGPRVSTDAKNFATLLASIDDMADVPVPPEIAQSAAAPAPAALPAAAVAPAGSPAIGPGTITSQALPAARFAPRGAVVTPVKLAPIHPVAKPHRGGDRRALLALGVPAELLGDGPVDENLPLSDLLARLGRPPAVLRTPGAVIAVVGPRARVLSVATWLAERTQLDPHDVVLAGDLQGISGHGRLLSRSAAAQHRARAAAAGELSIVAIGVGANADAWPDAAALLAELGPDQAWAVVDARRKSTDLRAWLAAVGGARAFDLVAATSVHETQEPGTVLDLGVPVGWIDGLPASPVVWAAVLSERLDVGARWD